MITFPISHWNSGDSFEGDANIAKIGNFAIKSYDGGQVWSAKTYSGFSSNERSVEIVKMYNGYLFASNSSFGFNGARAFARSFDGGETWANLNIGSLSGYNNTNIQIVGADLYFVTIENSPVSATHTLYKSTNFGTTWTTTTFTTTIGQSMFLRHYDDSIAFLSLVAVNPNPLITNNIYVSRTINNFSTIDNTLATTEINKIVYTQNGNTFFNKIWVLNSTQCVMSGQGGFSGNNFTNQTFYTRLVKFDFVANTATTVFQLTNKINSGDDIVHTIVKYIFFNGNHYAIVRLNDRNPIQDYFGVFISPTLNNDFTLDLNAGLYGVFRDARVSNSGQYLYLFFDNYVIRKGTNNIYTDVTPQSGLNNQAYYPVFTDPTGTTNVNQ